jgi:transposase-like protein
MRDMRLRDRSPNSKAGWLQRVEMVKEYRANNSLLAEIASRYGVDPAYIKTWDKKFRTADGTFGFEQLLEED